MKYCVYKKVKDNIPGFRDWDVTLVKCFDNRADAEHLEDQLNQEQGDSIYHPGYGAGEGTIDTWFFIKEENN